MVITNDILWDDFPSVRPTQRLGEVLQTFRGLVAERLPVVDPASNLIGSLSKGDLLLSLSESQNAVPTAA